MYMALYHPSDTKPRVILMQNPNDNVMHTGDSVSFSCHINVSSGWEFLWYKDGSPLAESGNNHTITYVLTKNTGSYKCQTKRGRNTVFHSDLSPAVSLNIKGKMLFTSLLTFFCMCMCWLGFSQFWLCVCRASKGWYNSLNWLVRGLLHWQLGAQVWGAGKPGYMELHMVITQVNTIEWSFQNAFLYVLCGSSPFWKFKHAKIVQVQRGATN